MISNKLKIASLEMDNVRRLEVLLNLLPELVPEQTHTDYSIILTYDIGGDPDGLRCGEICITYKDSISVRRREILMKDEDEAVTVVNETVAVEISDLKHFLGTYIGRGEKINQLQLSRENDVFIEWDFFVD